MRITPFDSLHADAGHRNFDFLKVTTDDWLIGWSEYNESLTAKRAVRDQSAKPLSRHAFSRARS